MRGGRHRPPAPVVVEVRILQRGKEAVGEDGQRKGGWEKMDRGREGGRGCKGRLKDAVNYASSVNHCVKHL